MKYAEETGLTEEQLKFVNTFRYSGENLLTIINDILDISKIEAGEMNLESIPLNCHELAENIGEMMMFAAEDKGVNLMVDIDSAVPTHILGDPTRIGQVITNLTSNAIKFTPQGSVVIALGVVNDGEGKKLFKVSIRDSGIGIPANKLDHIFESFSQADASTTRKYGGTGLGLSISKELVRLMGGTIKVESKENEGSVFSFAFPLLQNTHCLAQEELDKADLTGISVLSVDDIAVNQMIIHKALSRWGCRFAEVSNGPDCIEELQRAAAADTPYDIILLDLNMPGMDGLQVTEIISENPQITTPIIVVSSSGDRARMKVGEIENPQIYAFTTKPVRRTVLYRLIGEATNRITVKSLDTEPASKEEAETLPKMNILIAEDNKSNRNLMSGYLKKQPHTFKFAHNGKEAVHAAQTEMFDLILMDIEMPEMDGHEATLTIRKWESANNKPRTPIVALTAHALKEHEEKSMRVGCDAHLTKPIKKMKLLEALARFSKVR